MEPMAPIAARLAEPELPSGGQLSADMIYRYSRQLILPSFGVEAQANLLKSFVLVIGAGGLGSPALLYLAACGVGVWIYVLSVFCFHDFVVLHFDFFFYVGWNEMTVVSEWRPGRLGIVDHDVVELNNLHRQVNQFKLRSLFWCNLIRSVGIAEYGDKEIMYVKSACVLFSVDWIWIR